jgi:hypothetical protein
MGNAGLNGEEAMLSRNFAIVGAVSLFLASTGMAAADGHGKSTDGSGPSLQEQSQNPIASLISVPFQSNWNFGTGKLDRMQYVMNIQPVIPVALTDGLNLILRPIVPIINKPKMFAGDTSEFGLGDISPQIFLSPSKPVDTFLGDMTWGIGPNFLLDTATDDSLGTGKWAAGPNAVVFFSNKPWTYGALVEQTWSFAGDSDRDDVNRFGIQPFVNYNLDGGWSLVSAPIITANWEADSGDTWTLPLGGGVSKLFKIGKQPIQASLRSYYNVVKPEFGPDWQLQFQVTFLFPK